MVSKGFVVDADALIRAKRQHYRFCFCPGFWELLLAKHASGELQSIDRVKKQLKPGDELHDWAYTKAPGTFFDSTRGASVLTEFGAMMRWVNSQANYTPAAKAEFASAENADGWLVAYAKVNSLIVVTHEIPSNGGKRVKIPNVCKQFGVPFQDPFDMLEHLKETLILA